MDFMKVIDQTVRQIKREVNLKVLKVPEIEQKVLDATDNEPWGPHGTALAEIAQATKKYFECQLVMNVIWTRLAETGKDWRYVYKALAVIEYLIANGSERALDDIIEHTYQISSLSAFEFVEPNGKDMGINVRKKTETIVALLNNGDKIQEVRNKAAATREKYVGLSSRELSYKSGSPSFSGSKYEGFSGRYDSEVYKYKNDERFQEGNFEKYVPKSQRDASSERNNAHPSSRDGGASSKRSLDYDVNTQSNETAIVLANNHIDDDDDFDPRGTTSSKPACSPEVDLFGESLIGELGDAHTSSPPQSTVHNKSSEADFFSEADILSAVPQLEAGPGGYSQTQPNIDLFATESATDTLLSSTMDFFAPSAILPETKSESRVPSTLNSMDPFASITSSNFDESDLFGPLISQPGQSSLNPSQNSLNNSITNDLNGMSLSEYDAPLKDDTFQVRHNNAGYHNAVNYSSSKSLQVYKEPPKKDNFQVKSGIWADSLSRGLIDLNIASPKKVNLAEIGIIGLSDNSEQKPKASQTSSYYMGAST